VPDLLAAVPAHQVAELVELAARAHTSGALAHLAPAGASPGARTGTDGISGPVFVEHWADGDLLIPIASAAGTDAGAGGMLLLDIKTVISVRDADRVGRWLWQLLGYAWLDARDRYRIRAVGLYLARHGAARRAHGGDVRDGHGDRDMSGIGWAVDVHGVGVVRTLTRR
jgi:hypothetical protein